MNILNILLGRLLFFLIILVHEFGHFTVAKLCKMKVKEFAIGMGPKLFKKRIGETVFAFKALPIGGSVMLDEDVAKDRPEELQKQACVDEDTCNRRRCVYELRSRIYLLHYFRFMFKQRFDQCRCGISGRVR